MRGSRAPRCVLSRENLSMKSSPSVRSDSGLGDPMLNDDSDCERPGGDGVERWRMARAAEIRG